MKASIRVLCFMFVFCFMAGAAFCPSPVFAAKAEKKAKAAQTEAVAKWAANPKSSFDAGKMSDMSDFDPNTWEGPKGDDVIKIAYVNAFSGPAAINGQIHVLPIMWAVHDINKRGGIMVDGKKRLVTVIKADHMSKPDQCKKIVERMVLQEKVHVLMGTSGSNLMKIINEVGNKYKIPVLNQGAPTDSLMDAENFGRYSFMPYFGVNQVGRSFAYYYGQIRKKETKFYILCQDYSFGHEIAEGFKQGMKEFFPEAQIVGEDYHKLFMTDFAPYLTKIKASGADVIFSGDWPPDSSNLLKQARQLGINIPLADIYGDEPNVLHEIGIEKSKGIVGISPYETSPSFKTPGQIKLHKAWIDQSKKWKAPYNSFIYRHGISNLSAWMMYTYWLLDVIERARSTDAEKILAVWEGDTYGLPNGKILKMSACDHKGIQDLLVVELVPPEEQKASFNIPPYHWYEGCSFYGTGHMVPAEKVIPWMDPKLDRCKGQSGL